jgi:UDP-galactopyranose mutase
MKTDYDIIIVGAGISGAVLAERYANVLNKKVLVIEKRDCLGGNCHDFINEIGLLIPKYGPHLFHTDHEDVWEYLSRFSDWLPYQHRVLSFVDDQFVPIPVNITTVNKLLKLNLQTKAEMTAWLTKNAVPVNQPRNSEEVALSRVGRTLYEKLFKEYTKKHWDFWPNELDAQILARIPVRTDFNDYYFSDKYQAMPKAGYTQMFKNLLNHPNIEVCLKTNYFDVKEKLVNYEKLFFTGPIDKFFDYAYGKLQYRSLDFKYETLNREWFQPTAQVNYPSLKTKYTRIVEPKHTTGQKSNQTTIIKERSSWGEEPYYPVLTPENKKIYEQYKRVAEKLEARGIYFIGRLANFEYLNMDQTFKKVLDLFNRIK